MDHHPRKRFGQHFLCDQVIIERIIDALKIKKHDHLIEIGPGQGALTIPILNKIAELEVIEFDRDLPSVLKARSHNSARLHIYLADALAMDYASLKKDTRPLRIFGNLPYNISTPLIFHLLNYADIISDMLFMLQKEVALRLAASANEEEYGRLSVMVQYHCDANVLFAVPPAAFYPPPKVQSSMVQLVPYQQLPYSAKNYPLFAEIVKQAFNQRRKTLRNSLQKIVNDQHWEQIATSPKLRAENLSVMDFVAISNVVAEH